jgi:hypothetical protein
MNFTLEVIIDILAEGGILGAPMPTLHICQTSTYVKK